MSTLNRNIERRIKNLYIKIRDDSRAIPDGEGCRCIFHKLTDNYGVKIYPKYKGQLNVKLCYLRQLEAWNHNMAPRCWGYKEEYGYTYFFTEIAKVYDNIAYNISHQYRNNMYKILEKIGNNLGQKYLNISGLDLINDMHEGNFGLLNGKWVIIDFSHSSKEW